MHSEHSDHTDWLMATKLYPPRMREDIVGRKQLLAEVHNALLSHSLTLVSAPAGYGKTTLLGTFVESHPELLTAWLSLDEEDNDPARFLSAIIATIQHAVPACGARAQVLLTSLPNPEAEARRIIGALVNEFLDAHPGPFVLILDDLHLVTEPAIYGTLDDLRPRQREPYLRNLLPLTHSGSHYLLWGFEYPLRWWEKLVPFYDVPFYTGEVEHCFGQFFEIEKLSGKIDYSKWPPGYAVYLMMRKNG